MTVLPASPGVAPPPAGPGVQPPFAAPPSEGRTARVWWGIGLGALAVVLFCGAGVASVIGLGITGTAAVNEQAQLAVEKYLQAVGARRYPDAYDLLCPEIRNGQSLSEFTDQVTREPQVRDYNLHKTDIWGSEIVVPADVTYTDGAGRRVDFRVTQETDTGQLRYCGLAR